MKKYLMLTALAATMATGASAGFQSGFHGGVTAGYAYNSMKMTRNGVVLNKSSASGFVPGLSVGYLRSMGSCLVDVVLALDYNSASLKAKDAAGTVRATYKPRFDFTLIGRFGRVVSDKLVAFIGLGLGYDLDKVTTANSSYNVKSFSVTPEVGVRFAVNDKISLTATTGYKFVTSVSPKTKATASDGTFTFSSKFSSFVAKVGLSYHF